MNQAISSSGFAMIDNDAIRIIMMLLFIVAFRLSALTLLVGRQDGHLTCKKVEWMVEVGTGY